MSSRLRLASFAAAMILTSLPIAATLCAMVCVAPAPVASTTTSHGAHGGCDKPAQPAAAVAIQALVAHDCGEHEGAPLRVSATPASRADRDVIALPLAVAAVHVLRHHLPSMPPLMRPAASAPDVRAALPLLVLRV